MSETIEQAESVQTELETGEKQVDWQAKYEEMRQHSREWEQRAKANKAAADELQQIKAAQMSNEEKLTARAEAAEAKLAELEAAQAHAEAAQTIAAETGVPVELLTYCADADAMRGFASKYVDNKPPIAPSAAAARVIRGENEKRKSADVFADFMKQSFKE